MILPAKKKKRDLAPRLVTLSLSAGIILVDQVSKLLVTLFIPKGQGVEVIGDFFRIIHVQNLAIAFSIGRRMAEGTQRTLFSFLPLLVVALIGLYYIFTREEITGFQRWCFGALIGGGLGNYVDRIFRHAGVVDWADFKFYGLLGMQRWPTFNVADATLVVSAILLFISFLIPARKKTSD
jgi:signal peptidase II